MAELRRLHECRVFATSNPLGGPPGLSRELTREHFVEVDSCRVEAAGRDKANAVSARRTELTRRQVSGREVRNRAISSAERSGLVAGARLRGAWPIACCKRSMRAWTPATWISREDRNPRSPSVDVDGPVCARRASCRRANAWLFFGRSDTALLYRSRSTTTADRLTLADARATELPLHPVLETVFGVKTSQAIEERLGTHRVDFVTRARERSELREQRLDIDGQCAIIPRACGVRSGAHTAGVLCRRRDEDRRRAVEQRIVAQRTAHVDGADAKRRRASSASGLVRRASSSPRRPDSTRRTV